MTAPSEDHVLLLLGHVVFEMQETEATLHLAMTVAFGLSVAKSIEQLRDLYGKKTLGQFLALVREKIGLNPSFDEYMKDYIERRNFAIHNFSRTSIFGIDNDEGREKLAEFLTDLRYRNRKIKFTFVALTEAWMRVVSPEFATDAKFAELRKTDFYKEVERDFVPSLRAIFGKAAEEKSTTKAGE
ncbi:MAG: hypothetical protein REI94_06980 [Moraxellaceae bacterium]|nr:hypothetical protein [Moraxellaceae bacterium]